MWRQVFKTTLKQRSFFKYLSQYLCKNWGTLLDWCVPLLTICDADWGPSLSYGHYLRELSRTSSLWLEYTPLSYRLFWLRGFIHNDRQLITVVNTQTQNWGTLVTTATRYCPRLPHLATLISGHLAGVPGHHTVILSYPPRTWIWPNSCVLLTKWSLWQIAGQNRPTHDSLSDQHLYMELIFCLGIHKNPKYLSVSHCSHETVSSLQLPGTGKSHIMTWLALCGVF